MKTVLKEFLNHQTTRPTASSPIADHEDWAKSNDQYTERMENLFEQLFDANELEFLRDLLSTTISKLNQSIDEMNKIMRLRAAIQRIMGKGAVIMGVPIGMITGGDSQELDPDSTRVVIADMHGRIKKFQLLHDKIVAMLGIIEVTKLTA